MCPKPAPAALPQLWRDPKDPRWLEGGQRTNDGLQSSVADQLPEFLFCFAAEQVDIVDVLAGKRFVDLVRKASCGQLRRNQACGPADNRYARQRIWPAQNMVYDAISFSDWSLDNTTHLSYFQGDPLILEHIAGRPIMTPS